MAISLLVEHLCWISASWLLGITPSLRPKIYIEYSNDLQLITNSITSATLSVVKVGSEIESIAINIHTDFKIIHLYRQISQICTDHIHALLDGEEMEETKEPGEEDFRKELRLARKRIQELEEENRDLKAKLQKLNS